jgi:uncharacterized protein
VKKSVFICVVLLLCTGAVFTQQWESHPIPKPDTKLTAYVTDETSTLSSEQKNSLETKLTRFDKETSTQVVVYMISTLGGESFEETSYEIAEKNGIGQKGKNNGVLLFIVKNDRKLRIEVGYGLEGTLPDALCDQIIRKEITPYFKQGRYYDGISAGVDAIIAATKGEYTQDKKYNEKQEDFGVGCCGMPILVLAIFFFFGFFFVFSIIRRIFGWGRGSSSRSSWWNSGSWSSGSSSSWSSGSSGFSGGGGSFGGGGASGSW